VRSQPEPAACAHPTVIKSLIRNLAVDVQQKLRAADPAFIDVKRLIAELSDEELMRSADDYFASMTLSSEQCRKPFSNPSDSVYLSRHLGLVLEAADLFRGARVMEFGCGTGWLTLGLAAMGCDAVGVDISPKALQLAEGLKAARGPAQPGKAEFQFFDGHRLPLPDDSIDRIVCFDAFHHVRDQRATLKEFARVLRSGGRAAFLEPGPNHSKTPMSQAEMAAHKVIENDVSMEEVTQFALEAGLDKPQMLVQFQRPFTVTVDDFNAWARGGIPKEWSARFSDALQTQLTNGQCFFIYKGQPTRDSRRAEGLAAVLELVSARRTPTATGVGIRLELKVRNSGSREWITAAVPGQVNLGVHILTPAGELVDNNFARLKLPGGPAAPGESVTVSGTIREPGLQAYQLRLDMVAELVAWFADLGHTRALVIASDRL
jgi:ubiquinone/menaquinone biosynthesis C-methylase UbiE